MNGREKRHETKPFGRKKKRKEKKNIGLCYSKLLTQFTMTKMIHDRNQSIKPIGGKNPEIIMMRKKIICLVSEFGSCFIHELN